MRSDNLAQIYPNGQCILVSSPKKSVIHLDPFKVYPLNDAGFRVFELIGQGTTRCQIGKALKQQSQLTENKLNAFIEQAISAGLLTTDGQRAGSLRVKPHQYPFPLERIFLEVTSQCNLFCAHCYMSASAKSTGERELSHDEIATLIQYADKIGVYRFDFTGGELFVRKDIQSLLKIAREHYMLVNIFTNGTLLNPQRGDFLASLGNIRTVFVSLDDLRQEVHDRFRDTSGAFRRASRGIQILRDRNIRVVINITLWKGNADRANDIISYCRNELGVECRIAPIVYVGRGKCFSNDAIPIQTVVNAMKTVIGTNQRVTLGYCGDANWKERNIPGCGVGHRMLYIRSNGEICLCPTLSSREASQFYLGRLGECDLDQLWKTSPQLIEFRQTHCMHQDCIHLPTCRGGCRSRAFLEARNLNAPDALTCAYFGTDH